MTTWRYSKTRLAQLEADLLAADIRHDELLAVPMKRRNRAWKEATKAARAEWLHLYNEVEMARLALWRRERHRQRPATPRTA
jgi:hypothetical protein